MAGGKQIDGLLIINAKRPIKLSIKKQDVAAAAGSKKEPRGCAVARACYRDLHVLEARVHLGRIYLRTNDHNWVRYATPHCLKAEIIAFDRGGEFEPQDVVLYPAPDQSAYNEANRGREHNKNPTNKRQSRHVKVKNVRAGPA